MKEQSLQGFKYDVFDNVPLLTGAKFVNLNSLLTNRLLEVLKMSLSSLVTAQNFSRM
jgi:hypothetical protein